jgi:four helix bundle protein
MQDFRTLKVWQKGHQLTVAIYKATGSFPRQELYGLTSQIRRASASIPANIAEACGRAGKSDFARFLQIAMGSASELEYHLLLASDLSFLPRSQYEVLQDQVVQLKRMLAAFIGKVRLGSSD